ncbi:MAG: hypothetical protein HDR88_15690 [Bacteroides sp.]|nr:hypothetical protein [Bacteroides sp.]
MTKRFIMSALITGGLALSGSAGILTPDEALARLMLTKCAKMPAKSMANPHLEATHYSHDGTPSIYVFNLNGGNGYIFVSADDATTPLLGYSDKGEFDSSTIPPALRYWIDSYSRQIAYQRAAEKTDTINGGGYTGVTLPKEWTAVEPLLTTRWNQTEPYNELCPEYKDEHCVTGCVATAMAQTMNYFKYPEVGRDSVKYRAAEIKANLKYNFEEHPFDWENMLDDYYPGEYTETQANAVAELMVACGMSVKMKYTTQESGAYSQDIPNALIKYFNYDEGVTMYYRDNYSYTEWAEMIYDNLKNVGPVIYDGQAPLQGGHSFVCDGYDGNGYFHFNWGWAGLSDGYFLLDALTPEAIGTGGYYGGFSMMQDIIIGIQPPVEGERTPIQKRATQYGALTGDIDGNTLYLGVEDSEILQWGSIVGWGYDGDGTAFFDFGGIIENIDDQAQPVEYITSINFYDLEIKSGQYAPYDPDNLDYAPQFSTEDLTWLTPGQKYKFTFASKDLGWEEETGKEAAWLPLVTKHGYPNYIYLSKDEDGEIRVEDIPIGMFTISNVKLPEKGYYDQSLSFEFDITNNNDFELSRNICAILANEESMIGFISDSFLMTLAPGETITYKWTSPMIQFIGGKPKNGQVYMFGFIDISNMWEYETEPVFITMEYEGAGVSSVSADSNDIIISYDKVSKSLTVASQYDIISLTATSTNGTTIILPTAENISTANLQQGLWIIKAIDKKGNTKTLKVII